MFDVYSSDWPVAVTSTDPRDRFHERALHEARIATDYRTAVAPMPVQASLVTRLRLAIARGPAITSTEPCSCPA